MTLQWDWKGMLDKSFPFFRQYLFFEFVCFPPFFTLFSKNNGFLRSKALILVGNRQIEYFFSRNEKFECTLGAFWCPKYILKALKLTRCNELSNTTQRWKRQNDNFLKKAVICEKNTKFTFFSQKMTKTYNTNFSDQYSNDNNST